MRFARRSDCQHTGIYFLFGRDSEMNDTVYIGEAEKMFKRLKQHVNDHEEWNECVAVISKDDHLNKAHVKRLEFDFYQQAIQAQRYVVTNGAVPAWSSVSEYDQAMLSEFIDHAKLLIATLGYKPFEGIGIPGGRRIFRLRPCSIRLREAGEPMRAESASQTGLLCCADPECVSKIP